MCLRQYTKLDGAMRTALMASWCIRLMVCVLSLCIALIVVGVVRLPMPLCNCVVLVWTSNFELALDSELAGMYTV